MIDPDITIRVVRNCDLEVRHSKLSVESLTQILRVAESAN